jgi:hypothetical protein
MSALGRSATAGTSFKTMKTAAQHTHESVCPLKEKNTAFNMRETIGFCKADEISQQRRNVTN